jgi:DNA uptake protein ComE-like DNA-binding protein
VLIAASSLRDKDAILERMKQHQQQQAQMGQQQAQVAQQMASAKIADMQSKANANNALAGERQHNVTQGRHDMLMDLNAPPDNPPGAGPQPQTPEQMHPDVALAHHIADLAQKHANIRKTQADAALAAAKVGQVPHQNLATQAGVVNTLHQAANTAVTTNRLAQTPIPQPAPPTGP